MSQAWPARHAHLSDHNHWFKDRHVTHTGTMKDVLRILLEFLRKKLFSADINKVVGCRLETYMSKFLPSMGKEELKRELTLSKRGKECQEEDRDQYLMLLKVRP